MRKMIGFCVRAYFPGIVASLAIVVVGGGLYVAFFLPTQPTGEMMDKEEKVMIEDERMMGEVMIAYLQKANGRVDDTTEVDDPPHWVISGQWTLDCGPQACNDPGSLESIVFEMEHDMMRPDGGAAHSHSYSGFSATTVTVSADALIIEGSILGSGPIGDNAIVIQFNIKSGSFTFELPGNSHLQGELAGAVDWWHIL